MANPDNPCNKYWNQVRNELKAGTVSEHTLKKLAEDCQDYMAEHSNFGWDGWMLSEELNQDVINALRDAAIIRKEIKAKE